MASEWLRTFNGEIQALNDEEELADHEGLEEMKAYLKFSPQFLPRRNYFTRFETPRSHIREPIIGYKKFDNELVLLEFSG